MSRLRMKYPVSKVAYLILLEMSLPIDVALGIGLYKFLEEWLGNIYSLTLFILLISSLLGVALYLLHMWQMEFLTGSKEE